MNRVVAAGASLTLVGIGAYAVGIFVAYPGRAFSLTALMVGVSLLAVGGSNPAGPGAE